ncbi:HPr family phosphocarrier protein [Fusibacter sp. 3D3]|uniref:HPr family phosphocarrier protein n=1 Tax=Fusibacter sp. 3D3 TaxID=1048380 RepID=UPI0008534A34|nr:HPr family phosphocarrier protein [Fusibacter sp. 3D3]GAU79222.1 phosphotransferase system, phosphocarrier protein HPr [Fusibacter sp. 3D3]
MEKNLILTAEAGFHARPASIFAKKAMEYSGDVTITFEGKEINGKSVMSILTLGAVCDSAITIKVVGEEEALMMDQLVEIVETMK